MFDTIEESQLETIRILSIAINMAKVNDEDLIPFLEEQIDIIQKDIDIHNGAYDKVKELDRRPKQI